MRLLLMRIVCLLFILSFAQEACAGGASFSVRSLYLDAASGKWEKEITWVFNVKDSTCISVSRGNRAEPDITIYYLPDGLLATVEDHVSGRRLNTDAKGDSNIVLSWGFPVPYDYLAPFDDNIREVVVKREAGGVTFSHRMTRDIRDIGIDEALSEKMIAPNAAKGLYSERLRLITIKRKGDLVVRQLWPAGGPWWLYEETSFRRSWLVER